MCRISGAYRLCSSGVGHIREHRQRNVPRAGSIQLGYGVIQTLPDRGAVEATVPGGVFQRLQPGEPEQPDELDQWSGIRLDPRKSRTTDRTTGIEAHLLTSWTWTPNMVVGAYHGDNLPE